MNGEEHAQQEEQFADEQREDKEVPEGEREQVGGLGPEGEAEDKEGLVGAETGEGRRALEAELAAARAELQKNYDRLLRTAAELDNFRKRTARLRVETREETLREVLLQIAPILDNLNRALAQENLEVETLKQGVELILAQFREVLERFGLQPIEAVGRPFDPNLHEALLEISTDAHPPGTVVEEMEKGYTLNNKVVRPSRVVVSKVGE